jgi:hypothetical protein
MNETAQLALGWSGVIIGWGAVITIGVLYLTGRRPTFRGANLALGWTASGVAVVFLAGAILGSGNGALFIGTAGLMSLGLASLGFAAYRRRTRAGDTALIEKR